MHSLFEDKSIGDVKDFAERLRTRLQAKHGFSLGQGKTLHLLAEINGFDAWAAFEKHLGCAAPPSTVQFPSSPKTDDMSSATSQLRELGAKFLTEAEELAERLNYMNQESEEGFDTDAPVVTVNTYYGPVNAQELENLRELFGEYRGEERLTVRILEKARQVSEKCDGFRSSPIAGGVVLLADMLNTVLYSDAPKVLSHKVPLTVGQLAQKALDDVLELSVTAEDFHHLMNEDEDEVARELLECLDFAARLEP